MTEDIFSANRRAHNELMQLQREFAGSRHDRHMAELRRQEEEMHERHKTFMQKMRDEDEAHRTKLRDQEAERRRKSAEAAKEHDEWMQNFRKNSQEWWIQFERERYERARQRLEERRRGTGVSTGSLRDDLEEAWSAWEGDE